MARFIVGIDLGTTNCAVSYVDTEAEGDAASRIHHLAIRQVTAPGEVDTRATLPSFLLLPTEHELQPEAMSLPWSPLPPRHVVGTLARERGAELPHRQVSSAKSWLSYSGVDRTAAILPWRGADPEESGETGPQVSPVEASSRYLSHLADAWEDAIGEDHPLAEQDVYLTVPASFDAVARELTVAAARQAGLEHVTLLEEPQAAFYSWLAQQGDGWRDRLSAGDVVLVCDIGGGTTDFSLIAVTDDGEGNLMLERVAVGDHILLGGDNMDLTLAHAASQRLKGESKKLSSRQFRSLIHACRRAKETLLGGGDQPVPITILGSGSKLIGGSLKTEITPDDVQQFLLGGFFPDADAGDRPKKHKALGLRELGLPYATDPAVSRHLAEFLGRHEHRPTAILWNGGVMKSELLRERIGRIAGSWHGGEPLPSLAGTDLDLAVAHGAAYYGLVQRGTGIRIRGGTARSYYIGVESAMPAIPGFAPPIRGLCVAPFGMEAGSASELEGEELGLTIGEPTTFRFFASSSRPDDAVGQIVDPEDAELVELAPVETTLEAGGGAEVGDVVPVSLSSHVTEVGTLELWCRATSGDGRWKLEYSVRDTEGQ